MPALRPRAPLVVLASLLLLTSLGGLAACTAPEVGAAQDRSRAVLPAEQIREYLSTHPAATAYDMIRQYRPNWLSRRNPNTYVWVYEAGTRVGDANRYLRGISLADVSQMEYLTPTTATARFGIGHEEGAILVTYR
jgi:hypothetical protein